MRRSTKKKTVKKKTATQPEKIEIDFDGWADSQKKRTGCQTCRGEDVGATIRALLESCIRKRAFKFSIPDLRATINKRHPGVDVGQRGLERHLRTCERALYFRARGRHDG